MTPPPHLSVVRRGSVVRLGHLELDAVREEEVLDRVARGITDGVGGSIVTPNVDIWLRSRHDAELLALVDRSDLVLADGAPLVWSAAIVGTPLPERVAGSALVESLAARGATEGWSVFIIGGGPEGTAELAESALVGRYPGLRVVGAITPPFGFERDLDLLDRLVSRIVDADADLVLVGLGFPKQERLAALLADRMPSTWFLGCGAGVQMAAGTTRRAPEWVQRSGGEWVFRLFQDPRRLAKRYLVDDIPAVLALFSGALASRLRRRAATTSTSLPGA